MGADFYRLVLSIGARREATGTLLWAENFVAEARISLHAIGKLRGLSVRKFPPTPYNYSNCPHTFYEDV